MKEKSLNLTVRVTESMFGRIERLAESLSRPGSPATRSMALRYVLVKGLDAAESLRGLNRSVSKPERRRPRKPTSAD